MRFYQFGLSKPKENYRFLYVAYTQRLVIVIEDEHFATEFSIHSNGSYFDAEDSIPSFHYISELVQIFLEEYPLFASKI
jgi:hypothetical protein